MLIDVDRLKRRIWAVVEEEVGPAAKVVSAASKVHRAVKKKSRRGDVLQGFLDLMDLMGAAPGPQPQAEEEAEREYIDVDVVKVEPNEPQEPAT